MTQSILKRTAVLLTTVFVFSNAVRAQQRTGEPNTASQTQQLLDQSAADQKYTFLLFYKEDSPAARAMAQTIKQEIAKRENQANLAFVQITNPAERGIVARFDVSRAPMPLTMAIAPNGAITGIFAQKVTAEQIDSAFVTPTMTRAMKSLQEGKLVLVCVHGSKQPIVPASVQDFQADPHFKDRLATVSFQAADPAEGKFLNQMQIDPRTVGTTTVLLAPPGVLVGKFDARTSKDEIAAALAKAGKCCDDPNCKHHQQQPAGNSPRTATQQAPRARR